MKPLSVTFSIAAGLLGGTIAPYIFQTTSAHAQAQVLAPKVLEAGTFRLVNEAGHMAGTITINAAGSGVITSHCQRRHG
jgi:Mn2+/Fe2+ NRAMP family transporter